MKSSPWARAACIACALSAAGSAWAAAPTAEPGLWEVTTRVTPPKLPFGMKIPPGLPLPQSGSRRLCVAQSDIDSPRSLVKSQTGCELTDWRQSGEGRLDWKASCQGQLPSTSTGSMTLAEGELKGTGTVTARIESFSLPIQLAYSGRRLADCP